MNTHGEQNLCLQCIDPLDGDGGFELVDMSNCEKSDDGEVDDITGRFSIRGFWDYYEELWPTDSFSPEYSVAYISEFCKNEATYSKEGCNSELRKTEKDEILITNIFPDLDDFKEYGPLTNNFFRFPRETTNSLLTYKGIEFSGTPSTLTCWSATKNALDITNSREYKSFISLDSTENEIYSELFNGLEIGGDEIFYGFKGNNGERFVGKEKQINFYGCYMPLSYLRSTDGKYIIYNAALTFYFPADSMPMDLTEFIKYESPYFNKFFFSGEIIPVQQFSESTTSSSKASISSSWKAKIDKAIKDFTSRFKSQDKKIENQVEKIEKIEKETIDARKQVQTVSEDYAGIMSAENSEKAFRHPYFKYLSTSYKRKMLCGFAKDNKLTEYSDLGYNCEISYQTKSGKDRRTPSCKCKEIK